MFPEIRSIHFVGIGGTAMASVAVALKQRGLQVTGSDQNVYPPMSTFLEKNEIEVAAGYSEQNLQQEPDLVVIGNAISRGNPEAELALDHKMRYCSLPELLREYFIRGRKSIVVTGTHGKTTTTALLAWVFEHNGFNPSFLVGGIPINFGAGARFTDSEYIILEGDEYDTAFFDKRSKFVHYLPDIAVINNIEFDHADIFRNLEDIQLSFRRFINILPRNGQLFANGDDPQLRPLLEKAPCPTKTYGFEEANSIRAFNVQLGATASSFELPSFKYHLALPGAFNVRNALAVIACARHCGLKNSQIQAAFDSFKGIRRRMEVRGIAGGVTVIDDFGHHPTAIRETLGALRLRYPQQKIWAVFEPRSNTTRRNVFQTELAQAFLLADAVLIAEVARLELLDPSERLDPAKLIHDLTEAGKPAAFFPDADQIVDHLAHEVTGGDVVCVFSNGGFGNIHQKLLARLG